MRSIKTISRSHNIRLSLALTITCYILAVYISNIKEAITLSGATINPFIGFIFPILFYLKLDPASYTSPKKILAIAVLMLIVASSILGLMNFFMPV